MSGPPDGALEDEQSQKTSLVVVSREKQELSLLADLLCALRGINGVNIRAVLSDDGVLIDYVCDEIEDCAFQTLVHRFLPLCRFVSRIRSFVSERLSPGKGMVSHAMAASLRSIILDYERNICEMDDDLLLGGLSLSKMWFKCQPIEKKFRALASMADEANSQDLRGSPLLNLIHKMAVERGGDPAIKLLLEGIWRESFQPYWRMLYSWIHEGIIADPFGEFLVQESHGQDNSMLPIMWEQRYSLRQVSPPHWLTGLTDNVLNAGKCVDAIRICGKSVPVKREAADSAPDRKSFCHIIKSSYAGASQKLLTTILHDYKLMERLLSLKHCFLFDYGDFPRDFMDLSSEELHKWAASASATRLQALLELSIKTSALASHAFNDDISCSMATVSLERLSFKLEGTEAGQADADLAPGADVATPTTGSNSGWEYFSLDYNVPWPVSIVVPKRALFGYQALSRHLFQLLRVQRQLAMNWRQFQTARHLQAAFCLRPVSLLLQRMLHFAQSLLSFTTQEVVDPTWLRMTAGISAAKTVDEVISSHDVFLHTCIQQSQLADAATVKLMGALGSSCLEFASQLERLLLRLSQLATTYGRRLGVKLSSQKRPAVSRQESQEAMAAEIDRILAQTNFKEKFRKVEAEFGSHLSSLSSLLSQKSLKEPLLENLVSSLNAVRRSRDPPSGPNQMLSG